LGWDSRIAVVCVYGKNYLKYMVSLEKLLEIVEATGIEVKEGGIDPKKTFRENGIDSLDAMTLFLNIEEAIGVKFTEEEVEQAKTINDIHSLLEKRL